MESGANKFPDRAGKLTHRNGSAWGMRENVRLWTNRSRSGRATELFHKKQFGHSLLAPYSAYAACSFGSGGPRVSATLNASAPPGRRRTRVVSHWPGPRRRSRHGRASALPSGKQDAAAARPPGAQRRGCGTQRGSVAIRRGQARVCSHGHGGQGWPCREAGRCRVAMEAPPPRSGCVRCAAVAQQRERRSVMRCVGQRHAGRPAT